MPLNLHLISYLKTHKINWKLIEKLHHERLSKGHGPEQLAALNDLPRLNEKVSLDCSGRWAELRSEGEVPADFKEKIEGVLEQLKPWRKGPFKLFGYELEAEWDSSLKWERLKPFIGSLRNQRVLDVGANSGYYMLRMLAENPSYVLGVDPSSLFFTQFQLMNHYLKDPRLQYLAVGVEALCGVRREFDVVFCMGILYHRKSPVEFLRQMQEMHRVGGRFVLETLTIEGHGPHCLCPIEGYAKMSNVYFLPTDDCLVLWLKKAGFRDIEVVDATYTTLAEQRKTKWMDSESLDHFLDPEDPSKTIEGFQAPRRTLVIARA